MNDWIRCSEWKNLVLPSLFFGAASLAFTTCCYAADPDAAEESAGAIEETEITEFDRAHWAWQPLRTSAIPSVRNVSWCETAIDRFVLVDLENDGLSPAAEASRATLVRRLTLDLTGLPPTVKAVSDFVHDLRADAYERLVDRLLCSPDYGRHSAQGWLDLARFAETDGFEHDKTRTEAWRYRDWVIDALNEDKGYDHFVRMQIAGDVYEPAEPVATAFCLSGPDMPDINLQEERADFLLNDMTATIGGVFLALQTGCAQCHDHKYDPVSQADFYRLRAILQPDLQIKKNQTVSYFSASKQAAPSSRLMLRGDWRRPGPELSSAFPRIANPSSIEIPAGSTGGERRRALADWLTLDDHPLTARVMVNRVWQHHFGVGLSATPNDFGVMGEEPEPADLLDYLATEFVNHGWSRKWLDRQIVLSATYRQSSIPPGALEDDLRGSELNSEGRWNHFPRQRLTGEQIRDAMLFVSDELSHVSGGESVMPPLPTEMLSTLLKGHWKESPNEEQHRRRSIYIFARRNLRYPTFDVFDRPAALASCAIRNESTTAVQSLTMLNSTFSQQVASRVAEIAIDPSSGQTSLDAVRAVANAVLPHSESAASASVALARRHQFETMDRADQREFLEDLAVAHLGSNAFLYVD